MRRLVCLYGALVAVSCVLLVACSGESKEPAAAEPTTTSVAATPEQPSSTEPAPTEPKLAVAAQVMPYGETKDGLIRGYFAYPESMVEPLPAVLVIHDWWGLDGSVKSAAERLAGEGYMVLAVDLFGGKVATTVQDAAALSRALLEEEKAAEANLISAHQFLTEVAGAPSVATLGWSVGGYWSIRSTRLLSGKISAAVVYYGQVDDDPEKIEAISAPLLGLYGEDDRSVPADSVKIFEDTAIGLNKRVKMHVYPGVSSGFANPDGQRFNKEVAEDAWQKTFSFLAEHLKAQ